MVGWSDERCSHGTPARAVTTVLVAPNAFKGSLTAVEAAAAMSAAAHVVMPAATVVVRPIADGGDGSVDALLTAGYDRLDVHVRPPHGSRGLAPIALRDDRAVVELANSCGLLLTASDARDAMGSSTLGLGDAMLGALAAGAHRIVLCVGGSASTDGGVGLLTALGARVVDVNGRDVAPGGRWLAEIASIDVGGMDPRLHQVDLIVATDVDSPLFGSTGAAHVFAPQKGATPEEVALLDAGLRSWARVVAQHTGRDESEVPGAGAAGGTAFAAISLLGASVVSGAQFIAEAIGLDQALAASDLVITGEGSLDEQSLLGKGAVAVARAAQVRGAECVMVCGRIPLPEQDMAELGVADFGALTDIASGESAIRDAAALLTRRTIEVLVARRQPHHPRNAQ